MTPVQSLLLRAVATISGLSLTYHRDTKGHTESFALCRQDECAAHRSIVNELFDVADVEDDDI